MPLTMKHTASAIFGASMLLAGCGGPQASSGAFSPTAGPMQTLSQPMDNRQQCQNDGDVKVDPCRIKFTSEHAGSKDVIVTANGDNDRGHAIKEQDDCAARNIATIAKDTNRIYTVTPGTAMGTCTALFHVRNDGRGGPGPGDRDRDGDRGPNNDGKLTVINAI